MNFVEQKYAYHRLNIQAILITSLYINLLYKHNWINGLQYLVKSLQLIVRSNQE